jgi:monoamine oxidase
VASSSTSRTPASVSSAQELGLQLDNVAAAEPNGTEPRYHFGGQHYSLAQATRDLKPVWQPLHRDYVEAGYPTLYSQSTARGRALDRTSIAEWIDRTVPGGLGSPLGKLLDVATPSSTARRRPTRAR